MSKFGVPMRPAIDRFADKIALTDSGCWQWIGSLATNGYGSFYDAQSLRRAHRWSYEFFVEPIPEGLHIDHLCKNRACVNPEHLEPVTQRQNNLRAVSPVSANAVKTHCIHGHALSGDNVYYRKDGKGLRMCRACMRTRARKYARRKGQVA